MVWTKTIFTIFLRHMEQFSTPPKYILPFQYFLAFLVHQGLYIKEMDKYLFSLFSILRGNLHITVIALFLFCSLVRFFSYNSQIHFARKYAKYWLQNPRAAAGRPPLRIQVPETDTIELFQITHFNYLFFKGNKKGHAFL